MSDAVLATKIRATRSTPCGICGGHDEIPRGEGRRCWGYSRGDYVYCTRSEYAGELTLNPSSETYGHRLIGYCKCGQTHNPGPSPENVKSPVRAQRPKSMVATHDYRDGAGELIYQVLKFRFDDTGEKCFQQRRPDGNDGWIYNLQDVRRLIYRLPELLAAPADAIVFIAEGEKDVERLTSLGLISTCNSGGAGKFGSELAQYLQGRHVVILADNDTAGHSHTEKVALSLRGVAASVKKLAFPGLRKGGDVSDWLDAGGTTEELLGLVSDLAEYEREPSTHTNGAAPALATHHGVLNQPFPEKAWRGIFAEYRKLVGPTTEAPDTYHFWLLALALGLVLGRLLSVYHARLLYPNFFIVLVGPTGWARKDTAWSRIEGALKALHADVPVPGRGRQDRLRASSGNRQR